MLLLKKAENFFMMQKLTLDINEEGAEATLNDVLKTCKKVEPDMKVLLD